MAGSRARRSTPTRASRFASTRVVVFDIEPAPERQGRPAGITERFEQPEPGRFRASYPSPGEFHLTFTAAGYQDAEVLTPRVTELKTIAGDRRPDEEEDRRSRRPRPQPRGGRSPAL